MDCPDELGDFDERKRYLYDICMMVFCILLPTIWKCNTILLVYAIQIQYIVQADHVKYSGIADILEVYYRSVEINIFIAIKHH